MMTANTVLQWHNSINYTKITIISNLQQYLSTKSNQRAVFAVIFNMIFC